MRDHIRREAGQYVHAAWWLVPVAFAAAALAAVALSTSPELEAATVQAVAAPVTMAPPQPLPPPSETAEVAEHVQAF